MRYCLSQCHTPYRYVIRVFEKRNNGAEGAESELPPPRKKRRGQNKHRPRPARISFSEMLCPSLHDLRTPDSGSVICPFKDKCRYTHDVSKFMSNKPPDIGGRCYLFNKLGKCPYGTACRFGSSHVTTELVNVVKEGLYDPALPGETCNLISRQLQEKLRKRQLQFERSERYLANLGVGSAVASKSNTQDRGVVSQIETRDKECFDLPGDRDTKNGGDFSGEGGGAGVCAGESTREEAVSSGAVTDEGEIQLRPCEKRKVYFVQIIHCLRVMTHCARLILKASFIWHHSPL